MVRREDIEVFWDHDPEYAPAYGSACTARLQITGTTHVTVEFFTDDGARAFCEEQLRTKILRCIFGSLDEPLAQLRRAAPAAFGPQINPDASAEFFAALDNIESIRMGVHPQ